MWRTAVIAALVGLMPAGVAHAATISYVFAGTGPVTLDGVALGNSYSITFTGNTTAITSSPPYYYNSGLTGVFSDGGVIETITANVESNASSGLAGPNIDFYNATYDNGLGLQDSALLGYMLNTSIGPISAPPGTLTPTLNTVGDGFATAGGTLEFTGSDSLTFTAVTPLPSTWALMLGGLVGIGFFVAYRRRNRSFDSVAAT